jgi:membrane-bound metal-dependent hydrolase YbcI (DUF457 family)
MFIGHLAVGFASKRAAPQASLGALFAAPILLDLLWAIFLLAGWEKVRIDPGNTAFTPLAFVHYPISHSLVAATGWAVVFALVYLARTRYRAGAVVIGLGVVSHWFLDALVHRPDLPLYPGSTTLVGLGLWNSVAGTIIVEGAMFGAGVWAYNAATRPRDRVGSYAFWLLVLLSVLLYAGAVIGPLPPSPLAVALGTLCLWLLALWSWWLDRHRAVEICTP